MKDNKRNLILIGLMILISIQVSGETRKLRDIGRYRFLPMEAGLPVAEMLKSVADKYADDIRRGFEAAGAPELYAPFMYRLRESAFAERDLSVGTKMAWMIFRSQGQIKVIHDLEWAGRQPLPVCSISIQEGDRKFELIIPKSCGNIALERVESAPAAAEEPAPKPPFQERPESRHEISRAKIYQEIADLINEVDLYCSFSVWEKEIPELKLIGAEREDEKTVFSDGDLVYLNKGKDGAVEPGQVFWVLDITPPLADYGPLSFGKGRVRVLHSFDTRSVGVVENSCDGVRGGYYLVPFEPREGMMGKDLGYDIPPAETEGAKGHLIYLSGDLRQIGSLQRALIDIGEDRGLQVGQQLILYRRVRPDLPPSILGNGVIIDVKSRTSTIKVLSCRDILRKGDLVMDRPR
ncbi:MAG: hypothetical protein A2W03_10400 [Candidatus Aminicenantes bacterium RBG_16_63_16]|nr:MAG: hypothetical protein A2W03_10400 [Candidatus Aminicenantes bacterium RBG_16_63_16]